MGWTVLLVVGWMVAGAGCGAAVRMLLGWLRRGAVVPAGVCEGLLAGLWGMTGAAWLFGLVPGRLLPPLLGLGWLAVAAGPVDVLHRRLPDALTLPAVPAGLLLVAPTGTTAVGRGAVGALLGVSVYGVLHLRAPAALGAGDVKLATALGGALAGISWPAAALAAVLAGGLTVLTALVTRQAQVPHGPAMLAAAWLAATGVVVSGAPLGGADGG